MTVETITIVGAGQAGGWAAQTLRKEGFAGRVVLVGDESHVPYERPPLSKAVLSGEAVVESTHLFKAEALAQLALDWRPGTRVVSIDRSTRHVLLSDGSALAFDRLILCTGGRARTMTVPGADLPGVFTLRSIDDARALGAALSAGKRVVVVGGGWIGLEVAATARKIGAAATVVEAMNRLCERTVPPELSEWLLSLHMAHGTQVLLGASVTQFTRDARGELDVLLGDGRRLTCDVIVVGIGLVANDELAREAGLACDGGVIVDSSCRTSDAHIFAAGDVACWHCDWAGRRMRLESWQNAQEQGIAAARAALGNDVTHQPLPWFWSDQYESNLQIYGMPAASHEVVTRGNPRSGSFILFFLDGDRIRSAMGVDSARDLRFARRLIESQKSVDAERLADTSVPLSKF